MALIPVVELEGYDKREVLCILMKYFAHFVLSAVSKHRFPPFPRVFGVSVAGDEVRRTDHNVPGSSLPSAALHHSGMFQVTCAAMSVRVANGE